MNDLKSAEENSDHKELFENIVLRCPRCGTQKMIQVPSKVITQSGMVITIGIPVGLICDHSFQAYVDKFSSVRGYQVVDFLIPKTEYLQSALPKDEQNETDSQFTKSPLFQNIIYLLRNCVDDREILGSAVFTTKGNVLYSSIPDNTLIDTMSEFEVRSKEKLHRITKMFLELKNHQKVCSEYIQIIDLEIIVVLFFAEMVNFAIGNMYLKNLVKSIESLT
ncbi:MAG: hypothetical protein EAX91_03525 [Candidatus Lokiarchaeota archaeon]|nr:hypothetical protein [Candidatus Lokiarchaeota archaeon]